MQVENVGPASTVGRVRAISPDRMRLWLDLRSGLGAWVDGGDPFDLEIGSVVLIDPDGTLVVAPNELWPDESWVGVVRLKLEDVTVVDTGGRWRILPTRGDVNYREANTVEAQDSLGVVRVLSDDPIKYLDLPAVDDNVIAKFRSDQRGSETFQDFGGLQSVVERAVELIEVPLRRKDALSQIGARSIKGVLFTGLPGTGKTMLARIIANSTESTFYEISGPEVFSKWYGQSPEIIRRLFEDAAKQEQAIIFFDEIDSVAGDRGGEAHEESRRVVAQLLTMMDGFSSDDSVVVIAATNRPDAIDSALRRPGRFDWELHFPLPDLQDRMLILQAAARRLLTSGPFPHRWVAQQTDSWSAAELAAIWSEAALLAVTDDRSVILPEDYVGGFERVSVERRRSRGRVTVTRPK